jgi:Head domain of trimeric autotransporter adhesin/H-type lectin domain
MGVSAVASGNYSTAMGLNNTATGDYSTAMGTANHARGNYSAAMGYGANANHHGSFVWSDSQDFDFVSTATNQFLIRAGGGVGINTANPAGAALAVVGGIRTGVNGTVQSRVQFGTATVGTGTNGVNTFTITFPTAFTVAPKVFVMAKGNDNPDTFAISTRAVTTANFKVNIVRIDITSGWGQPLQVDWYAVE